MFAGNLSLAIRFRIKHAANHYSTESRILIDKYHLFYLF